MIDCICLSTLPQCGKGAYFCQTDRAFSPFPVSKNWHCSWFEYVWFKLCYCQTAQAPVEPNEPVIKHQNMKYLHHFISEVTISVCSQNSWSHVSCGVATITMFFHITSTRCSRAKHTYFIILYSEQHWCTLIIMISLTNSKYDQLQQSASILII